LGPATDVLAGRADRLTTLQIDRGLANTLRQRLGDGVEVVDGDATAMPFSDGAFSAVACFTMLHHVPSTDAQDRVFGEVYRVLRPGAPFAGTDSTGRGIRFALLHLGDIRV
jgi:ubiquinone/menaquinone biosynthesis C-methylase UbiE